MTASISSNYNLACFIVRLNKKLKNKYLKSQYTEVSDIRCKNWTLSFHKKKILHLDMRQCENKDLKIYQARTRIIALGWYWVTMIFFGQIKFHCSLGMHNVQFISKNYCTYLWMHLENEPFSVHLWCSFHW